LALAHHGGCLERCQIVRRAMIRSGATRSVERPADQSS
jgi:hypothetical protein